MPFINWQDIYSVHDPEMDKQHKKFVDLLESLYDAMKRGGGKDQIVKTINELIAYTVYHFDSEEKLMRDIGFEGFESNKAIHEDLKKQIIDIQTRINNNEAISAEQVLSFLRNWLLNHIQNEDQKFGRIIAKAKV